MTKEKKKFNIKLKDGSTTYVIANAISAAADPYYFYNEAGEVIFYLSSDSVMYIRIQELNDD